MPSEKAGASGCGGAQFAFAGFFGAGVERGDGLGLAAVIGLLAGDFVRTTLLYLVRLDRRGVGSAKGVPASILFLMTTGAYCLLFALGVGDALAKGVSAKVVPAEDKTTRPSSSATEQIRATCIR